LFDVHGRFEISGADCSGYNAVTEYNTFIDDGATKIHFTAGDVCANHKSIIKHYKN